MAISEQPELLKHDLTENVIPGNHIVQQPQVFIAGQHSKVAKIWKSYSWELFSCGSPEMS